MSKETHNDLFQQMKTRREERLKNIEEEEKKQLSKLLSSFEINMKDTFQKKLNSTFQNIEYQIQQENERLSQAREELDKRHHPLRWFTGVIVALLITMLYQQHRYEKLQSKLPISMDQIEEYQKWIVPRMYRYQESGRSYIMIDISSSNILVSKKNKDIYYIKVGE